MIQQNASTTTNQSQDASLPTFPRIPHGKMDPSTSEWLRNFNIDFFWDDLLAYNGYPSKDDFLKNGYETAHKINQLIEKISIDRDLQLSQFRKNFLDAQVPSAASYPDHEKPGEFSQYTLGDFSVEFDSTPIPNNFSVSATNISIYIPRIKNNTSRQQIAAIFNSINIGPIKRIDIVPPSDSRPFTSAFIHFYYWQDHSQILMFRLENKLPTRIQFCDESFWIILPSYV